MRKVLRVAGFVVGGLLILGLIVPVGYRLLSGVWNWGFGTSNETSQPVVCQENSSVPAVDSKNVQTDTCLYDAGKLNLPTDIANYVCDGTFGSVSLQLQSGTFVPFGTFTMDAESRVWILSDFTVPSIANYSFDYTNARRNLLQAPFLVGSELGWEGQERVPFTVCYNFEGDCFLPDEIVSQLFPTK